MTDHRVLYGERPIAFSVSYREGLRDKVAIHVQPDRRVTVDAPPGTGLAAIKRAVLKRARWVHKQLGDLDASHRYALPRQYVSGETHWYMGKRYLLKVRRGEKVGTRLKGGRLLVQVPEPSAGAVQAALDAWYRRRARIVFARRLETIWPALSWVVDPPEWRLRPMRTQWGSCSPRGRLSLNPQLVKAPRRCIDYVILHELCHLRHHNHGEAFYRLLARHDPHWKTTKRYLDNLAETILVAGYRAF